MAKILKMPLKAPSKYGYRRATKSRKPDPEKKDQLNLFVKNVPNVLSMKSGMTPFEKALILDERGDRKAADAYHAAISAGDCPADSYCNLGIIESSTANTTKAFDCFTQALKNDPRHFESHYNLANLYFDLGDLRLAQVHYELAGDLAPAFPNIFFNLALLHTIQKRFADSVKAINRYSELVPPEKAHEALRVMESLKKKVAGSKR